MAVWFLHVSQMASLPSLLQPLARTLHLLRCSGKGNKPTSLWTTNHQWHVLACDPCGIYGMTVKISVWDKKRSSDTAIVTHSSILLFHLLSRNSTCIYSIHAHLFLLSVPFDDMIQGRMSHVGHASHCMTTQSIYTIIRDMASHLFLPAQNWTDLY